MKVKLNHLPSEEDFTDVIKAIATNEFANLFFLKIKITDLCNLRCRKCNHWRLERQNHPDRLLAMSNADLFNLAEQAVDLGVRKVRFSGGEPTLHPAIIDLVKCFSQNNTKCAITTNGTLLSNGIGRKLVEAGLHRISISIDGPSPVLHDQNVGVAGAFDKQSKGLKLVKETARALGKEIPITINTVISKMNIEYLPKMVELASLYEAKNLLLIRIREDHLSDKMGLEQKFTEYFECEVLPLMFSLGKKYGIGILPMGYVSSQTDQVEAVSSEFLNTMPCTSAWERIAVWPTGDVYICCETRDRQLHYGNVRESSLREMLNSSKGYQVRKICLSPAKHVKKCQSCWMDLERRIQITRQLGLEK